MTDKRPVIILGCGGHARNLIAVLRLNNYEIRGFVAPNPPIATLPIQYLGEDTFLDNVNPASIYLVNGVGSIGPTQKKKQLFKKFKMKGFSFTEVRHPRAIIASDVTLAEGAQIMAGAIIQAGTEIGANTIINTGASIDHDCVINAHTHIAPGAILSGGVIVGEGSHVGTGAIVIQSVSIGHGAIIGAGSVVIRDIEKGKTVCGNPSREHKS